MNPLFKISTSPLEALDLRGPLADEKAGGYVSFEGWVRDCNEGHEVISLEYEVYAELAEKEGSRILSEVAGKFGVRGARCFHRVGHLNLGEMAVGVGVTAVHRDNAFLACRYIIDEVKKRVPIWKKEHYQSGDSGWVGSSPASTSVPDSQPSQ